MDIFIFNFFWMVYNLCLGLIALSSGLLVTRASSIWAKFLLFAVWLFFAPNALYVATDIIHLGEQWDFVDGVFGKTLLVLEYFLFLLFGAVVFLFSIFAFEEIIKRYFKDARFIDFSIVGINLIIAFGAAMGRIQRTNSWEIVTNPNKVFYDGLSILISAESMLLVIFLGILGSVVYFILEDLTKEFFLKKYKL